MIQLSKEENEKRLEHLLGLLEQYPYSSAIASEINNVLERIREYEKDNY